MMDRQKGKIIFECNGCGDVLDADDADDRNFDPARERLAEEGGTVTKSQKGDWEHYCPNCV